MKPSVRLAVAVAALVLALGGVGAAAPSPRAKAEDMDDLCQATKSPWLTPQRCDDYLAALEAGIGGMTSFVQQEFVPLQGAQASAPKYEPSIVFATWEGAYITSGTNPAKEFEPITLTAVIDGVFACKREPFMHSKLFTFRQLGLTKALLPAANAQALQAMCSVTPISQSPNPASARLAQPWAYVMTDAKGATADNSGLYLGCQDYSTGLAPAIKFDGVLTASCHFVAQISAAASNGGDGGDAASPTRPVGNLGRVGGAPGSGGVGIGVGDAAEGASEAPSAPGRLVRLGAKGALAAATPADGPRVGALAGPSAAALRPDMRGALASAIEGALARSGSA